MGADQEAAEQQPDQAGHGRARSTSGGPRTTTRKKDQALTRVALRRRQRDRAGGYGWSVRSSGTCCSLSVSETPSQRSASRLSVPSAFIAQSAALTASTLSDPSGNAAADWLGRGELGRDLEPRVAVRDRLRLGQVEQP